MLTFYKTGFKMQRMSVQPYNTKLNSGEHTPAIRSCFDRWGSAGVLEM